MHNYTWLCKIMYSYAWLCITMHNYAKMSSLRFCHEWGQIKRWGAVRHVKRSGNSMRVFFMFMFFPGKKRVSDVWTFHACLTLFDVFLKTKMVWPKSAPEVSGTTLGPSPTYSGPFRTHYDQKSSKNWNNKSCNKSYNKSYKQIKNLLELHLDMTCRRE